MYAPSYRPAAASPDHRLAAARGGLSLIEVLISIFIISVGLLGVASLIPLAYLQADRGAQAERAGQVGHAALREFSARGMGDPRLWVGANLDPTNTASPLYPDPATAAANGYCIDPRGLLSQSWNNFPNGGTHQMPRVNLRNSLSTGAAMAQVQADDIFIAQDDLAFEVDKDQNDLFSAITQQQFGGNQKRMSNGQYSWMATLVRQFSGERYTLSVVVFDTRQLNAPESDYTLTFLVTPSIGGGEATIPAAAPDIRLGHWVMASDGTRFQWYRLIGASGLKTGADRNVTLAGPDWTGAASAKVTILPGVIGVYERTIRLETSSMWQR